MREIIRSKVVKYARPNISTDAIIQPEHLKRIEEDYLGMYAMGGLDPEFPNKVKMGYTIMVVGPNFGCGSMRWHAVLALVGAGVKAVIAPENTVARTFYRNAVNSGRLPLVEVETNVIDKIYPGDELEISFSEATIRNLTRNETYSIEPLSGVEAVIMDAGGLAEYNIKRTGLKI